MRYILLFIQFFLCLTAAHTQQGTNLIDSLLTIAQTDQTPKAVQAYKQLSMLTYQDSFDVHLRFADKGIKLGYEIDDLKGAANIIMNVGVVYDIKGMFNQAILYYDSAAAVFLKLPDVDDWLASLYINYGTAHYFAGNKSLSLDFWLKAYDKSYKDTSDINYGIILNNIAIIYEELGKYEDAIHYYEDAASLKKARKDKEGYLNTIKNLGRVNIAANNPEQALSLLKEAENGYLALDPPIDPSAVLILQSKAYLTNENRTEALSIILPLTQDTFKMATLDQRIEGLTVWADILMAQNKVKEAIGIYESAVRTIEKTGIVSDKNKLLDKLALAHARIKNFELAFQSLFQSKEHLEKMTSKDRLRLEQEMQVKFNSLQKEQDNILLENEGIIKDLKIKNSRRGLWILLSFLLIVTAIAILIYVSRKKILGLNNKLAEQKLLISRSLKEKEILLKEIHHRVKNNLQIVSSLLGIQSRQIKDQVALDAIAAGRARVHSMALIHQDLYKKDHPTGIELRSYFQKLTRDLLDAYDVSTEQVTLTSDIDEMILDVDTVVPLGLILNELITNALKYAFPEGNGSIHVQIKESDQGLLLLVKDDGIGYNNPEGITSGDSFGYDLIESFVENMNGEWKVISENGTEVSILLKDYKKAA